MLAQIVNARVNLVNKTNGSLELYNLIIIVRSACDKGKKYYPQFFLDEYLHQLSMLEDDSIDLHEKIYVNKSNNSH